MRRKYWIIVAVIVVIAAAGSYFLFKGSKNENIQWRTAKVEKGDVKVVVTATGTLSADTTVLVGTQVSGTISKIFVDFNSVVRKGQVIAIIDTTFLAAAVVDAKASLNKANVQVDLTKRTFDRTNELFNQKVMAQADYDQAWSDYQTALANARSAKAALDRAYINLRYATIIAPVSGVVVSRAVDVGQTVAASFNTPTLFTIANDLTKMQVQASVDEADIGKIQVGQDVTFTVDAYDNITFRGNVRQIRLQPTVLQNVVNYTVIIDVPNPDLKLLPGMTANITVKIQEADSVLKVPSSALRFYPTMDVINSMMKLWPDSTRKKVEAFLQRAQGKSGQGKGMSGQGTGGQSLQSGGGQSGSGQTGGANRQGAETRVVREGGDNKEIIRTRPEFGFLWVLKDKVITPHRVKIGLTDGSYTEVEGKINEGDEIVTGMINTGQASNQQQQQSPFMPQMGRRR